MSSVPKSLEEFKAIVQASFTESEDLFDDDPKEIGKSLKAYLIESHRKVHEITIDGYSEWNKFEDANKWYYAFSLDDKSNLNYFVVDTTSTRIWIFYTLQSVRYSDKVIKNMVRSTPKLDYCWLSRNLLESFGKLNNWIEKGIGLRYRNILEDSDNRTTLSLKAWYGYKRIPEWDDFINKAKQHVTITSIRWKKIVDGNTRITSEWYNYGKVTISASEDVDETIRTITSMARKYEKLLLEATKLRDETYGAFELNFSQKIDLNAFSDAVSMGKTDMNLWLTEIHSEPGFKRFSGVDMHTWDVVFLDMAEDYAYLTIPGNGCVNAAPRLATIQAENTSGRTELYFNGDEIFV